MVEVQRNIVGFIAPNLAVRTRETHQNLIRSLLHSVNNHTFITYFTAIFNLNMLC